MKKIHLISMLLLVVGVFCSCTNKDYQKAIPADASLVMRVEFGDIAQKSDFLKSDIMKTAEQSLEAAVKKEDMEKVKTYLEDPMEMGLDFSEPAYFFMVGMETFGMTMKVKDEGALKDFIEVLQKQGMATKPIEKDGLMCGTLIDEIHYSYDANACLFLASPKGKGKSTTSRMARELMNQKEGDSFLGTDGFGRLEDMDGDVTLYTNVGILPEEMIASILNFLPDGLDAKDLDLVSDLNFEDGKATLTAKLYGNSSIAKQMIKSADDCFSDINGEFVENVSDKMVMWFGTNMKGEEQLKYLKASKSIKEMLFMMERVIDIEQMLKAVDGDFSVELQMDENSFDQPEFVSYAQLKNTDFLADVDYWKGSMEDYGATMTELAKNQYQIKSDEFSFLWGVDGKNLYMSTGNADRQSAAKESPLKPYAKDIKKSKFFVFLNLEALVKGELKKNPDPMEKKIMGALKALVAKAPSANEMSITVELQNKDENFLKQLF